MSQITILHGPSLAATKPKPRGGTYQPCTWTLGARVHASTVDAVERLARLNNCKTGDIIRTALAEFLAKHSQSDTASAVSDPTAHQSITQPRTATQYTGSGGSDQNALRASANRSQQRKANSMQGERLIDKSVVR